MSYLTFKQFVQLNEHQVGPHITQTLQQVIDAGKITNTVQSVIMAQVIGALSNGDVSAVRDLNAFPATSSAQLKQLPAEDQVHLAQQLLNTLSTGYHISSGGTDPSSTINAWINSAPQRQK